jgi:hypothetical protein
MQHVKASVILSTGTNLVAVPVFAKILSFRKKDYPSRIRS